MVDIEIGQGYVTLEPKDEAVLGQTQGVIINTEKPDYIRKVRDIHPHCSKFSGIFSGDHVVINPYSETQLEHGLTIVAIGDVLGRVSSAREGSHEE